jgi:hypothetical protein
MSRRVLALAAIWSLVAALAVVGPVAAQTVDGDGCPAPEPMKFEAEYIDMHRAGGEPIVTTHPEGQLLWGSHAGTTHFYSPAAGSPTTSAFLENYEGQTYQYVSEDGGVTWDFIPRQPISTLDPESGLPNSGFSDPEFAIDKAGNVYISEINLANIAISKSSDGGRSYKLQSLAEITFSDRQWMEADEEDVLWFVANTFGGGSTSSGNPVTGSLNHFLYKSTDGGVTFSEPQNMGGQQSSDIEIDKTDGSLYELHSRGNNLELWIARDARNQVPPNVTFENIDGEATTTPYDPPVIAENYNRMSSIGPTLDIDPNGNLYVVWDDGGRAGREPGIYFTYSTDRGMTWAEAIKLSDGTGTAYWPWVAAGEHGAVATWLQHEDVAPNNDPSAAEKGWYVMAAQVQACDTDEDGAWDSLSEPTVVQAFDEAIHTGTICTSGTTCQAFAVDRRLGDYFANAIDRNGNTYISVSDTRQGGAVSLPLIIRQTGGPGVGDLYANDDLWGAFPAPESPGESAPGTPGTSRAERAAGTPACDDRGAEGRWFMGTPSC